MSSLKERENDSYLEILEAEDINIKNMKEKVKAEHLSRTRKVLESKLKSGNLLKAINTWAVSDLHYSSAFIDWSKEEISEIDRTRKLLTMHKAHHPKTMQIGYTSKKRRQRAYQHRGMCRGCNSRSSPLCPEYSGKAHRCSIEITRGTRSNRAFKDKENKRLEE